MPGNENRTTDCDRGPAENFSDICTARCTKPVTRRAIPIQVTFAQLRVRILWRDLQHAIEALDNDATPETRMLKKLAFRKWREVFVSLP